MKANKLVIRATESSAALVIQGEPKVGGRHME